MKSVLHQMRSPCEKFLFYWRLIGRLLDHVESLPTHKGSDSSESPNGGGENILIESSTVLNIIVRKSFQNSINENLIIC